MSKEIKVRCYREAGRKHYRLEWVDRRGRKRRRSAGTSELRKAERAAAKLAKELSEAPDVDQTAWPDFRKRFSAEVVARTRTRTQRKFEAVLDDIEDVICPEHVDELTTANVDKLTTHYYGRELAPSTIAGNLRYLRRIALWARDKNMLAAAPKISWPTSSSESGGRPITMEEYERMLVSCDKLRDGVAASWKFLLRGLWFSGLRISEAMALTWGDRGLLTMDLEGPRPMFLIKAELSKNGRAQRFPMAPEFFEMVDAVPSIDRSGFVFNPERKGITGTARGRLTAQQVGEVVGRIGREAGVKVKETATGSTIYASAHDLRRSFGFRWAKRVMPPILQKMMRHSDIGTTMTFYLSQDEDQTAEAVWEAISPRVLPPLSPPLDEKSRISR